MRPSFALLVLAVAAACDQRGTLLSAVPNAPDTFGVQRLGPPQKVDQLLGDLDRQYSPPQPTHLRTESTVGLLGADLGYPVLHQGKLFLFFADGLTPTYDERRPKDSDLLATVDAPTPGQPLDLQFLTDPSGRWQPLTLDGVPQGSNHVPVSGFSDGQRLWLFYYVDPTLSGGGGGYQKLSVQTDPGRFQTVVDVPIEMEFTVPRVVATSSVPSLPSDWPDAQTLAMWGRSHTSPPTLAVAPLSGVGDLSTWRYYAPFAGDGPWSPHVEESAQIYTAQDGYDCRGPFSVVPLPPMQRWVILERCVPSFIHMRVAESILGPWSPPITLVDSVGEGGAGTFMHKGCDPTAPPGDAKACVDANVTPGACCDYTFGKYGYMDHGELVAPTDDPGEAFVGRTMTDDSRPYAPFVVEPMTTWDAPSSTATVYFLMSTSNPYTVMTMSARLSLAP
jgi:hypothetical protein